MAEQKDRILLLDTYVDNLSMEETVETVDEFICHGQPLHLMGVNADKINMLRKNMRLKKIINTCDVINADGVSVVWASRFLGLPLKERVAGIDLMEQLVCRAEKKEYTVFFLGAKQRVVEKTVEVMKDKYPNLKIAGFRNGYFTKNDWDSVAEQIKDSKAQLVFVGITSPLKEYLVDYLQKAGINCVFMGVGGSFDVISGDIPRAPRWVQNIGMEWMFRVIQEPRRLWKRYLTGNIIFIASVIREKLHKN